MIFELENWFKNGVFGHFEMPPGCHGNPYLTFKGRFLKTEVQCIHILSLRLIKAFVVKLEHFEFRSEKMANFQPSPVR